MDDNKPDQDNQPAGAPPTSGGVMDVQPPKPSTTPEPTVPAAPVPDTPVSAPPAGQPSLDTATPTGETAPNGLPKHIDEHTDNMLAAHAATAHRKKPVVAIVVAVVIALALIGLTVFAYLQTKNGTKSHGDHEDMNMQSNSQQDSKATPADVDSATKDVDSAVSSIDDTKDMPESELTDSSLGL